MEKLLEQIVATMNKNDAAIQELAEQMSELASSVSRLESQRSSTYIVDDLEEDSYDIASMDEEKVVELDELEQDIMIMEEEEEEEEIALERDVVVTGVEEEDLVTSPTKPDMNVELECDDPNSLVIVDQNLFSLKDGGEHNDLETFHKVEKTVKEILMDSDLQDEVIYYHNHYSCFDTSNSYVQICFEEDCDILVHEAQMQDDIDYGVAKICEKLKPRVGIG